MKFILLLCACFSCTTTWAGQTSPPPAASPSAPVSGTKNVGSDRADAPQAPGMTTSAKSSAAPRKAKPVRTKAKQ